uniref:Uncharacterized protein n=2 Tax=Picea TaxID=3328 RepID=A0A117NGP1_PICGL|nr:hypothetical protein ABT39_MTgene6112 [Picea glauca]QHR92593.1 hypothetical protein Q903MT_gene6640 [Picea sitchensis]
MLQLPFFPLLVRLLLLLSSLLLIQTHNHINSARAY